MAVVARQRVAGDTADPGIAALESGARIPVVAVQGRPAGAHPAGALVADGADVPVVARDVVVHEEAALGRVARVIGAGIPVVAVGFRTADTDAVCAGIGQGAGVAVVAGDAVLAGDDAARPRFGIAGGREARCIGAFGLGAGNDRGRGDGAVVGPVVQVADEGPVAEVVVLERGAVRIGLAVAGDAHPGARPAGALVRYRTGIPVIAGNVVVHENAAAEPVAGIVGAGVVVVAVDGGADADALFAVVADGAGITVHAFFLPGVAVYATFGRVAPVVGAGVVVVTGLFVHLPVTVVIQAVAFFNGWRCRVAIGQPIGGANPLALAETELVLHLAGREERQLYGLACARATTRLCNALQCAGAGDCDRL